MIVPEFWAEAKATATIDGELRTYQRFGWSDRSEQDAQDKADARLAEAIDGAIRGEHDRRIDPRVAYNGAEGVPIREEILSRHGDSVITRNGYGALCLNTPGVLFADVDVVEQTDARYGWFVFFGAAASAFGMLYFHRIGVFQFWLMLILAALLSGLVGGMVKRLTDRFGADPYAAALSRIESVAAGYPQWILRVYRTPNGFRVLAMHGLFDPAGTETQKFMRAIGGDRRYALMCRNQKCFRARLSPKPWRIGIERHITPRPGVWPITEAQAQERSRWVRTYEVAAARYAACRYVKTLGKGLSSHECESVRRLHDELCKVSSNLPIA